MSLTGLPLLLLVAAATLAAPVVVALTWRRLGGRRTAVVARIAAVLVCQALAVATTFVAVNRDYVFYSDWSDLLGTAPPTAAPVETEQLVQPGQGTIDRLQVHGATSGASGTVLVWHPPQYDQPAYAGTKFPVLMVLPGQPSTPSVMFAHVGFAEAATAAIADHTVEPFVAVFPPLTIDPPRDTECTDVPKGPQAQTWLATDVRDAVVQHDRVSSAAKDWAVAGYSTGGFCAVKLLLGHPSVFHAAAGFGGYYEPVVDKTTGDLFGGSQAVADANSPLRLYDRTGLEAGHRLLLITGQDDSDSYATTEKMLAATRGDPNVSSLVFPSGGHNYHNYRDAMPQVLQWLGLGDFGG